MWCTSRCSRYVYNEAVSVIYLCLFYHLCNIFAFAQNWEIINTAVLTGKQISHAMKVFVVSYAGKISDVTRQSVCQIEDDSVLKVIYLFMSSLKYKNRVRDINNNCLSEVFMN